MLIIKPENLLYYLPQMIFGIIVAYIVYRIFSKYKIKMEQNIQALNKYLELANEQYEKYEDIKTISMKIPQSKISALGVDSNKILNVAISRQSKIVNSNNLRDKIKSHEERNYILSHLLVYMVISVWIGLMILLSPYNLAKIFMPQFPYIEDVSILVILASLIFISLISLTYYIYGMKRDMIWTFQAALTALLLVSMFLPSIMPIWSGNVALFAEIFISLLLLFTILHLLVLYLKKRANFIIASYFSIFFATVLFDILLVINLVTFILIHS
ncbi:MAG: hypothetical protein ACP5LV_05070 [Thermoplasmata archaeon]